MTKHFIAIVNWESFLPSDGAGGVSVYDFGSNKKRLLEKVGDGGTLWLITSRRKNKAPRTYHLAYKLVNCKGVEAQTSDYAKSWKYVVRAQNRKESCHFKYNNPTKILRDLEFTSGKPMSECLNIGLRLLSIPELSASDILMMENLQHKIEDGRTVFISYSRADLIFASRIELELSSRHISNSRDSTFLKPGQEFKIALRQEAVTCDCFVVLISAQSASSTWVKQELAWALSEYEKNGMVKCIVPILLPTGGWEQFPEIHHFHHWEYPKSNPTKECFDLLADGIISCSKIN